MNLMIISGRLCSIPKLKYLQCEKEPVTICVFSVGVAFCDSSSGVDSDDETCLDYFECVAFDDTARFIYHNFVKGAKIICRGVMRNHFWEDCNGTKHFSQIMVIETAEFGDTESVFLKPAPRGRRKPLELSVNADLELLYSNYKKVCENGFLCIDEDDYYRIAMSNI